MASENTLSQLQKQNRYRLLSVVGAVLAVGLQVLTVLAPPVGRNNSSVLCDTTDTNACFVVSGHPEITAKASWTINQSAGTVTIRTTASKNLVDNTYGANAIGWPGSKGHKFDDLVKSDKMLMSLYNGAGSKVLEFSLDYLSASSSAPSGYAPLGVSGGEGSMVTGSASNITAVKTSLGENLNTFGYVLTSDSPSTNSSYAANSTYPNWIYDVWYEVTVKLSAFGSSGFGRPNVINVHASPNKLGTSDLTFQQVSCPSPTPSKTPTPSPTPSKTPTPSPTPSKTPTPSPTPSKTPTPSPTPSKTPTPSLSPTGSVTPSPSPSSSVTPSPSPSSSSTPTASVTPSGSPVIDPSNLSKSAFNITQNVDATKTLAHPGNIIRYTLNVTNTSTFSIPYEISDDIQDVLVYSDVIDYGDGDMTGTVISWPSTDIAAGETASRSFTVRVKDELPAAPAGSSGSSLYDLTMSNLFGDQVDIEIDPYNKFKSAFNITQNADATKVVARAGDIIRYTLNVFNGSPSGISFQISDNIKDVLAYSEVIDPNGGTLSADTITWPLINIPSYETGSKSFMIQVKSPIPAAPLGFVSNSLYDLVMNNVYGNEISIKVSNPSILPSTGESATLLILLLTAGLLLFFYFRNRQLATEFKHLREDYSPKDK